ncbi:hypothetical protein TSAR_008428 [Trichomalopsis sarcophagae]|uniref:Uncharacterized protein n=1 Tax=Trichomalopsis sarcophagae TaxID=543379 RepID=A0A232EET5_9HYME|nr:hypothetical protein TSAR_008428 [Trichomalopsis sarcophagae]
MQNIVALACDNASIMTGNIKGFYTILKKDTKGLTIHKLYSSIEKIFKLIGQNFLNPESISQITSDVQDHLQPLEDVFFAASATDLLKGLAAYAVSEIKQFAQKCSVTFYESNKALVIRTLLKKHGLRLEASR